ncbi:MAG: amidinotransferase [Candidatus Binatia bacterium]
MSARLTDPSPLAWAPPSVAAGCPVNSHTEWDPLEEVIVGRLEGATVPASEAVSHRFPPLKRLAYKLLVGRPYPRLLVEPAQRQLAEFIRILEGEGVRVRRPSVVEYRRRFGTPGWRTQGFCSACPRDGFLVIGDQIIEAPMSWRTRYYEMFAYRALFKEYFAAGARWVSAPRPELPDALYEAPDDDLVEGPPARYAVNEYEPVFDAADFVRCGRDLFYQRSNVTNRAGIEWLRRHLGDGYRLHEILSKCANPKHIDTTFMPLAPGKVLVNPLWVDQATLPPILKSWDVLVAPNPTPVTEFKLSLVRRVSMVSQWVALNVLMLDEQRVIVEKSQTDMQRSLRDWGFTPIPCDFLYYQPFGGSFHCATLDVRRRGVLQSYFP